MSTIRVTFADGTHEDRPANSPALGSYYESDWTPKDPDLRCVRSRNADIFGWTVGTRKRFTHHLDAWMGSDAQVWRITGGLCKGEPITGQWVDCNVETWQARIARLEAERDAETARADAAEKRVSALRLALKRIECSTEDEWTGAVAAAAFDADDVAQDGDISQ